MKITKLTMFVAGLMVWMPPAMANLVVNGAFEGYFGGYSVSDQGLNGWTVVGANATDNVFVFGPTPGFGPQTDALDLSGFSDNSGQGVEQTISTLAGTTYRLSFDYWTGSDVIPSSIDVFVNGVQIVNELTSGLDSLPRTYNYTFIATGATTLKFLSGDLVVANDIDNVSVSAIPEPETYAMLLAGLGLVGFAARRRKQKIA